jgi:hypothetical protein
MRFLIYLVSFGSGFRHFTQMALNSIREVGQWPHDIVVLSDTDAPFGGSGATVINIQPDLLRRYPWFGRTARLRLGHCKPEIEHYVDLDRYDYVLYLDSDILVTTNRLVALVETLCRESHFGVQRDNVSVMSGASFAGGSVLTPEERAMWGHYQINSGVVGFPVSSRSRRILRDWRRMNAAAHFKSRDQGNLIAVLLRKNLGQWAYIQDATFGRRLRRYEQTLVHFTGPGHPNMAEYYEQILGLDPLGP